MRGHQASLSKIATLQKPTGKSRCWPSGENRVNALGESTLVTEYVARSCRQWGGQRPEGLPIAIETGQPIEKRPLRCRQLGYIYRRKAGIATASDGGDGIHERGYSSLERRGVHEPGREPAGLSDGTDLHNSLKWLQNYIFLQNHTFGGFRISRSTIFKRSS